MDINRIKDENNSEDPIALEVALSILSILIDTVQIIQSYQNNKNLKIENHLGKIKEGVANFQDISDQIMGILSKASIKETLLFFKAR